MKRILLLSFSLLVIIVGVTGCGKGKEEKNDGTFTMTCTTEKDNSTGIEIQNVITYNFNKNQLATSYSAVTTQKFEDKSVYDEYKSAQEETEKDTSEENITYSLKSDDDKMTLVFTMTIKNLDKGAETDEDKENIKASKILKTNEDNNATCVLKGIDKKDLK